MSQKEDRKKLIDLFKKPKRTKEENAERDTLKRTLNPFSGSPLTETAIYAGFEYGYLDDVGAMLTSVEKNKKPYRVSDKLYEVIKGRLETWKSTRFSGQKESERVDSLFERIGKLRESAVASSSSSSSSSSSTPSKPVPKKRTQKPASSSFPLSGMTKTQKRDRLIELFKIKNRSENENKEFEALKKKQIPFFASEPEKTAIYAAFLYGNQQDVEDMLTHVEQTSEKKDEEARKKFAAPRSIMDSLKALIMTWGKKDTTRTIQRKVAVKLWNRLQNIGGVTSDERKQDTRDYTEKPAPQPKPEPKPEPKPKRQRVPKPAVPAVVSEKKETPVEEADIEVDDDDVEEQKKNEDLLAYLSAWKEEKSAKDQHLLSVETLVTTRLISMMEHINEAALGGSITEAGMLALIRKDLDGIGKVLEVFESTQQSSVNAAIKAINSDDMNALRANVKQLSNDNLGTVYEHALDRKHSAAVGLILGERF